MLLDEEAQERNDTRQVRRANARRGDNEDDDGTYMPVGRLRRQYLDYITSKSLEIEEQKEARRYYHGAQWTAEEIKTLRKRRQPVVTFNRIGRKINGVVGLIERLRQDPKAYPRNPRNDNGAEVATSCIRYVCDTNDWKTKSSECARHAMIDGLSGIELKIIEGDKGDRDIGFDIVFGDDYFYDVRSAKYDFDDARYKGIGRWIDVDEACELFPDKEDVIEGLIEAGSDLTTNADREHRWVMTQERQVRVVQHWYKWKGQWCWAFYISSTLLDEGVSPFLDEKGKTMCPLIMFSAAVDHDGDRYGLVRQMKSPQDETNQRRSKMLHISNSRRLIADKGAVDDVETARREWARADGYIEVNANKKITPDDTSQDLANQRELMGQAVSEIENFANVQPATAGDMPHNMSGRAINLLQQGGIAELGPLILAYRGWKIRTYRAIWNACQRFWDGERWIRVSDDQDLAQFIQINGLDVDQWGRPTVVNAIGSLDVDIILDEGPDVINMMSDTFDMLSSLAQNGAKVPPQVLIELSPIQGSVKQRVLKMMEPPTDPAQEEMKRLTLEEMAAKGAKERGAAMTNVARAAHLASQAHLNAQEIIQRGLQVSTAVVPNLAPPQQPGQPGPAAPPPNVAPPPGGYSMPF